VPMIVWGDEFGRTQNGNNNPWNIDSVATWNNYAMIATNAPQAVGTGDGGAYHNNLDAAPGPTDRNPLFAFACAMARLRRGHPCLRQRRYGDLLLEHGEDVTYYFTSPDGNEWIPPDARAIRLRIDGSEVGDSDFLLMINMSGQPCDFGAPIETGRQWVRIVDTADWAESVGNVWPAEAAERIEWRYVASPFSVVVLQQQPLPG